LEAVLGRLSAEDAARYAAAAARALTDAMATITDPFSLGPLASGLDAVWPRLDAEGAAVAARALTDAMAKNAISLGLGPLAKGLHAVSARLSAEHAATECCILADSVLKDPNHLQTTTLTLRIASVRLTPDEAPARAFLAAAAFGESMAPSVPLCLLAPLVQLSQPLPSQFSTQQLVDLLKMPTCIGPVREIVLEQLGQRYKRTFADHWEFVNYAEKHLPGIDLKSPPHRVRP
jgi:hypothetical protein